jgi:hypothetical protein
MNIFHHRPFLQLVENRKQIRKKQREERSAAAAALNAAVDNISEEVI